MEASYIKIGDSSVSWCLPHIPASVIDSYIQGMQDLPNLGEGLNIITDTHNEHDTRISREHGCILAARIALYGNTPRNLTCGNACEYAEAVAQDKVTFAIKDCV